MLLVVLLAGCASTEPSGFLMPYGDENSNAPGDAWAGSYMFPRKVMPLHKRTPASDWEFYYKHCAVNGYDAYFRTSYECTGPYY